MLREECQVIIDKSSLCQECVASVALEFGPNHGEVLTPEVVVGPGPGQRLLYHHPRDRGAPCLHQTPECSDTGIAVHVARIKPDSYEEKIINVCFHWSINTKPHASIEKLLDFFLSRGSSEIDLSTIAYHTQD